MKSSSSGVVWQPRLFFESYSILQNDRKRARGYLVRLLQFAVAFGSVLGLGLFIGSSSLPQLFSDEAQVVALARGVIPVLALALVRPFLLCLKQISDNNPHRSLGIYISSILNSLVSLFRMFSERSCPAQPANHESSI